MTFHITYKASYGQRNEIQERFTKTGGKPPAGVTMASRWHSVNGNRGFIIAESSDVQAIGKWIQDWSDLLSFEVTPVMTDEQVFNLIS